MEKQSFHIEGMTCDGCERVLELAVSRLEGVHAVQADRQKGLLEAEFSSPCTPEQITQAVQSAGYSVVTRPKSKGNAIWFLVILLGLYAIARQLGLTELFQAFPTVSEEQVSFLALFLIGLLTSVHCVAMCGGLNMAQSLGSEGQHPLRGSLLYNLGRLTSYTLIGAVLGFIGEKAAISLQVRGVIGLLAGLFMLVMSVCMMGGFSLPRLVRFRIPKGLTNALASFRAHGPYAIGLVNGLMPCGPLQSMQLYAIASGSLVAGAASMFFFCLGTIPLVLLCGTAAGLLKMKWRRRMLQAGAALLVLMGVFTVQNNLVLTGFTLPGTSSGSGDVIEAVVDGDTQYVTTTLHANGYDDIQVVAGIPVVWTIEVEESALNGCNKEIILSAFDQQVTLSAGEVTITFTPEEEGTYTYSCWMGMLKNTITVTA
ncbi:MAG: sulfite exporter TauE/SafE family protein [Oscillospiraceae bacterium]|nr:sulfite exporter TauE/SafE family protein [Oscillospiraceae bacterium]